MLHSSIRRLKMSSRINIEIERKFLINEDITNIIKTAISKEGIAQWYLNNSRIRIKISDEKLVWIKEKKEDLNNEKRIEKVFSSVKDSEKEMLKNAPAVIKYRYYLDEEKRVSLDEYIFPEFAKTLEIELNSKENEQYLKIEKSKLGYVEKRKKVTLLFKNKIRGLPLHYEELIKNEKTNDKKYRNYSIAKKLNDLSLIKEKLDYIFYEELKKIYSR
jgi:CYTH domain-containing protein